MTGTNGLAFDLGAFPRLVDAAQREAWRRAHAIVGPKADPSNVVALALKFYAADALFDAFVDDDEELAGEPLAFQRAIGLDGSRSDPAWRERFDAAAEQLLSAATWSPAALDQATKSAPTAAKPLGLSTAPAEPFFVPIRELVDDEANAVEWLVPGIVPKRSLVLVFGPPKAGKSELLFAMVAALERGTPFLGRSTTKTPCVYASEENAATLREKARRHGLELTRVAPITKIGQLDRSAPLLDLAKRAIVHARAVGADLVVVDTVPSWAMLPAEGENDSSTMVALLRSLHTMAADGPAIVCVTHMRKSAAEGDPTHAIRGSSGIAAIPDVLVAITRPNGTRAAASGTVREVSIVSRYAYEQPPVLAIDRLEGGAFVVAASPDEAKAADERRRVLAVLASAATPLKRVAIKQAAGVRDETLSSVLSVLVDAGEIEVVGGTGRPGNARLYAHTGKSSPVVSRRLGDKSSPDSHPLRGGVEETTATGRAVVSHESGDDLKDAAESTS